MSEQITTTFESTDSTQSINETIAASQPFETFIFEGVFLIDQPLVFKGGGRKYVSKSAVLMHSPHTQFSTMIFVSPEKDPPRKGDWWRKLFPRFLRRLLHIHLASDYGASVTGFIINGGGQGVGIQSS